MKYTILINQNAVATAGFHTKTDLIDWAILDYIDSWQKSSKATRIDDYVWLNYKHLIQEMPLLGLRAKQSVSDRISKLRGLKLLESIQPEGDGGRLYIKTTSLFFDITQFSTESTPVQIDGQGVRSDGQGVRSDGQGVRSDGQGVRSDGHSTNNQNKQSKQTIKTNNNKRTQEKTATVHVDDLSLSLTFEETTPTLNTQILEKQKERQKEKVKSVVLFPLVGLDEKQKAEASKKLAQLSQEQRDIAIEMFNNTAQQGRIKKSPMALLNQLVNMGLNNELEAPTTVLNAMPTHTPTDEIKTPVEPVISEEEAKARDMAQRIRIAKQHMEKNKEAMLNDFKRIGAAYIGGHGAFFEPELRAAGLFD